MEKKNILWISYFVPYDSVPHAGGKTHNFYLKGVLESGRYNVHLISFAMHEELQKLESHEGLSYDIIEHHRSGLLHLFWGGLYQFEKYNYFSKTGGFVPPFVKNSVINRLKKLKKQNYQPDVILLQWTQMVLLLDEVKKFFPTVKVCCIEEDVSFLGYRRKFQVEKRKIFKKLKWKQYLSLKKEEVRVLSKADAIFSYAQKDIDLLTNEGITSKAYVITPYYDDYSALTYQHTKQDIVFFGAMSRKENSDSAIWFIDHAMEYLAKLGLRFVVIGSRPRSELVSRQSNSVVVTGFVEDISPYFQNSLCLVAPLLYGAGIKVKVIEALSAGIPVLTNDVGIEGIPAEPGKEYLHCSTAEDYCREILRLLDDQSLSHKLSVSEKGFINHNYNLYYSLSLFIEKIDTKS